MSEENKENKDNKKSKKTIRIIIAIVFVVLLIICAIINLLVNNQRPSGPIMTPEEIHRRDSLHNAYIKERDSIEMAQKEAHDGV